MATRPLYYRSLVAIADPTIVYLACSMIYTTESVIYNIYHRASEVNYNEINK